MTPLLELAQILEWASVRARNELAIPTEKLMLELEHQAKAYIGEYQDGWPALAESTLEEKTRLGYAPPDNPLLRTGEMRESIEHFASESFGGAEGAIGSNDPVANWQEHGTSRGIPPRPFIGLSMGNSEEKAVVIFGEFAVAIITRA